MPFVETRARGERGPIPHDGRTMGELEVRGPFVASGYFGQEGPTGQFTDDGWFRTGDIVTIDEREVVRITDREKDLVKSGGEWISSVALENALMGHPDVAEAAVIAIPDERWLERPLAVVVVRDGASPTPEELIDHLRPSFARWALPGRGRVRGRPAAHGHRQVQEGRAARALRGAAPRLGGRDQRGEVRRHLVRRRVEVRRAPGPP